MRRHAKAPSAGSTEASGNGRGRLGPLAALFIALAALALAAAPALAAPVSGYGPVATNESVPGNLARAAVDDSTGNLLIADPGAGAVDVFAPDLSPGGTVTLLTSFAVAAPYGIAIDQSNGAVYVSDAGSNRIIRFTSDGAPVPTYTEDAGFTGPALGTGAGQVGNFRSALAVDPANHDLLVGDVSNQRVSRYSDTGAFLGSFDGSGSAIGKFNSIQDIAVGAGGTYVVDYLRGDIGSGTADTRVTRFDSAGAYQETLDETHQIVVVAVDGARLLAIGRTSYLAPSAQLYVFSGGVLGALSDLPLRPFNSSGVPAGSTVTGLALFPGAARRAYTVTQVFQNYAGGAGIDVLVPSPAVEANPVTSPDSRKATLTGTVNPESSATGAAAGTVAHFEYSLQGKNEWAITPDTDLGSGDADVATSAEVTELRPHSTYDVRLVAADGQTTAVSPLAPLLTGDEKPTVVSLGASAVTTSAAKLSGTVNPLGLQSTYYFEYGEDTSYGQRIPLTGSGVAGNGYASKAVSRAITGLQSGVTYHYRLVASSSAGTSFGEDRVFQTEASVAPGAGRAYELVSPVHKENVPVDREWLGVRASADGDSLAYGTSKAAFPGSQAAVFNPRVLATRASQGWSNAPLDLPLSNQTPFDKLFFSTIAVSADLKRAALLSDQVFAPGAVAGGWNLYIREADGSLTFIASDPKLGALAGEQGSFHLIGSSEDLRTIAFSFGDGKLYEVVEGVGLRLLSVMPDGSPATENGRDPANLLHDANQVSADGTRTYFELEDPTSGTPVLYLRENGATTVPVSVSQRSGAPPGPVPGEFLGASPNGRYVVFMTPGSAAGLTDTAPDASDSAYRYDTETGELTFIAGGLGYPNQIALARPEQGVLYFQDGGGTALFYAHDGEVRTITSALLSGIGILQASSDGRYLAFLSSAQLTSYENAGATELYLYDAEADQLSCASCRRDGQPPSAGSSVQIGQGFQANFNRYFSRVLLDDGTVFFDTPDPLVGADVNGTRDVYSYRDGAVTLISRGKLPTSSQIAEVTPDGSDVFFVTDERLVAIDQDGTDDMYDARIGGGIPAQNVPPARGECVGADCRGALSAVPNAPAVASESIAGNGNVRHSRPRHCAKGKRANRAARKGACAKKKAKKPGHRVGGRGR